MSCGVCKAALTPDTRRHDRCCRHDKHAAKRCDEHVPNASGEIVICSARTRQGSWENQGKRRIANVNGMRSVMSFLFFLPRGVAGFSGVPVPAGGVGASKRALYALKHTLPPQAQANCEVNNETLKAPTATNNPKTREDSQDCEIRHLKKQRRRQKRGTCSSNRPRMRARSHTSSDRSTDARGRQRQTRRRDDGPRTTPSMTA